MAYLDDLIAARDRIATEMATMDMNASYSIDGQSVDYNAYRSSLIQQMRELNELIKDAGGPVEEVVYDVPIGSVRY